MPFPSLVHLLNVAVAVVAGRPLISGHHFCLFFLGRLRISCCWLLEDEERRPFGPFVRLHVSSSSFTDQISASSFSIPIIPFIQKPSAEEMSFQHHGGACQHQQMFWGYQSFHIDVQNQPPVASSIGQSQHCNAEENKMPQKELAPSLAPSLPRPLPLPLPRPWSAYALFFREVQREVRAQLQQPARAGESADKRGGTADFGQLSRAVARRWKAMDRRQKMVYRERLKELRRTQLRESASTRAWHLMARKGEVGERQ